jgi:hypothetical protein
MVENNTYRILRINDVGNRIPTRMDSAAATSANNQEYTTTIGTLSAVGSENHGFGHAAPNRTRMPKYAYGKMVSMTASEDNDNHKVARSDAE